MKDYDVYLKCIHKLSCLNCEYAKRTIIQWNFEIYSFITCTFDGGGRKEFTVN